MNKFLNHLAASVNHCLLKYYANKNFEDEARLCPGNYLIRVSEEKET